MNARSRSGFSESFLEPETRGGIPVTAGRKAAWKVLLDILEVFMDVCGKHALRWSMAGGSMIGACRERGFIPWDDDIDVMMPRPDYEKLQDVLPAELPPHLFMQTSKTAPGLTAALLKICDSRTTGIIPFFAERRFPMNYGICLDVMPVDPAPASRATRRALEKRGWNARVIRYYHFYGTPKGPAERAKKAASAVLWRLHGGSDGLYDWRERPFRKLALEPHTDWAIYPAHVGYIDRGKLKGDWFDDCIDVPFEYLTVKVLRRYDDALTQNFGDWRTPRNESSGHGQLVLDAAVDYKTTLRTRFGWTEAEIAALP